jgi:tRNA threonylcarbamoyladenosine biosynthesis protein TsaB
MPEHPILAFDTCGEVGTVALVDLTNGTTAVTCINQAELGGRSASAQLMPAVDEMLRQAGLDLRGLRALVVVNGPGSFTGTRVGLSTAKGLAHAAGVPIVAISRLAVLASLDNSQEDFLALLDAGRNEFYARRAQREWLASFEEIRAAAEAGTPLVIAEPRIAARLAAWSPRQAGPRLVGPLLVGPIDACAAARAALPRIRRGESEDLATLDANYLRRSDAELFARPVSAARP